MKELLPIALGLLAVITITGCSTVGKMGNAPHTVSLFDGRTLDGWIDQENKTNTAAGWIVTNGVIASTGAGRGTLYTQNDYGHFRLYVSDAARFGQARIIRRCVLIFCRWLQPGGKPLDALGGIQFQVPNWRTLGLSPDGKRREAQQRRRKGIHDRDEIQVQRPRMEPD